VSALLLVIVATVVGSGPSPTPLRHGARVIAERPANEVDVPRLDSPPGGVLSSGAPRPLGASLFVQVLED
jgi:hypothetical protein